MKLLLTCAALLSAASKLLLAAFPRRYAALVLALFAWCVPALAHANKAGVATEGCGCHSGGQTPTVMITPDLITFNPGQTITLTISIATLNGNPGVAGFYIDASALGTFKIVDSGTQLKGGGVTHTAPRQGVGGFATFTVSWTAPATPGGVDFYVYANSANGDGTTRGDAEGSASFSIAYGCAGTKYYHDYDGDGFATLASGYTLKCSAPPYYSDKVGDCDDNDPTVYPGAPEICDGKDNNCDGQIDEGLALTTYCTDADGDGHGVSGKATLTACRASKGWGLCDNDCDDNDPTIYPGAPEICDGKDNNCNGQIDEGVRTICGVGWCARYADGCGTNCTPGPPRAEECDDFDDDCDGVKDNGTDLQLCKVAGLVCRAGDCIPGNSAGAGGTNGVGAGANVGGTGAVSGGREDTGGALGLGSGGSGNRAPPAGCAFGRRGAHTRSPLVALGLVIGAAALRRRRRRRWSV
ncbi:MAG: MopE-related protein [Polyangiaceae bacterium]